MLVAVELPAVRIPAQPAVLDVVATKETLAVIVDMSPEVPNDVTASTRLAPFIIENAPVALTEGATRIETGNCKIPRTSVPEA